MSVVNHQELYIFNAAANCFYEILEKKLYQYGGNMGGPEGLPYKDMLKEVDKVYQYCDGILAQRPSRWPTHQQINNMTESLLWGKGSEGQYSLELKYAPEFSNSSFVTCFNDKISDWVNHFNQQQSNGLAFTFGFILLITASVLACIGLNYYRNQNKHNPDSFFYQKPNYLNIDTEQDRLEQTL